GRVAVPRSPDVPGGALAGCSTPRPRASVSRGGGMSPPGAGSGMIGGVARRVSSPVLVGRDAEAAQLGAALERAAAGRPAIVVVAGEAGVGKTRLVTDLVGLAGELGAVALSGGCLDVGGGGLALRARVEA